MRASAQHARPHSLNWSRARHSVRRSHARAHRVRFRFRQGFCSASSSRAREGNYSAIFIGGVFGVRLGSISVRVRVRVRAKTARARAPPTAMLDVKMSTTASPAIGRARSQVARNRTTHQNRVIEPFRAPPAPTDLQQRPQGTITGAAALSPMWGRCGADNSALPDERFGQEVLQGARFRVYAHAPLD